MDNDIKQILKKMCETLDDKFGEDTMVINVDEVSNLTEYFLVVNGNTTTHVKALAMHIEEAMDKSGVELLHKEGHNGSTWILLDYGRVILHIFDKENREFYNIEKLWSDGITVPVAEILA